MAEAGGDFPTIIGPDAKFEGKLTFEKGLRLQGSLKGEIQTPGRVHVSKEAKLDANVEAGSISVEGEVKGNLSANDRIELKNTARYEGDLQAAKLVVDEGAVFSGHVSVGPENASKPKANTPPGIARPGPAPAPMGANQPGEKK